MWRVQECAGSPGARGSPREETRRHQRAGVLLAFVLLAVIVAAPALPGIASAGEPMSLQEVQSIVQDELSGQKALESSAYVYRGWRVNGGPWFNDVIDWLSADLRRNGLHGRRGFERRLLLGAEGLPHRRHLGAAVPFDADGGAGRRRRSRRPGRIPLRPSGHRHVRPDEPVLPVLRSDQRLGGGPHRHARKRRPSRTVPCHLATNSAFTSPLGTGTGGGRGRRHRRRPGRRGHREPVGQHLCLDRHGRLAERQGHLHLDGPPGEHGRT